VREHGTSTARSARVTTKVLYASLPVSELSCLPPLRDNPLCHHRAPAHPFNPFHIGNLIHGLSAIPHPSRSMLVKRWARVALALAPSAYVSPPSNLLSLPSTFSGLSVFLDGNHTPFLSFSCCCTYSRGTAGAKMPETRRGTRTECSPLNTIERLTTASIPVHRIAMSIGIKTYTTIHYRKILGKVTEPLPSRYRAVTEPLPSRYRA